MRGGGAQAIDLVRRALVEARRRTLEAGEPLDAAGGDGGGKAVEQVQLAEAEEPVEGLRTALAGVPQPPGEVAAHRPAVMHDDGVDTHARQHLQRRLGRETARPPAAGPGSAAADTRCSRG